MRQGFVAGLHVQQEEAADHFLGFGEGAVQHLGAPAAHMHADALVVFGERFHGQQLVAPPQGFLAKRRMRS